MRYNNRRCYVLLAWLTGLFLWGSFSLVEADPGRRAAGLQRSYKKKMDPVLDYDQLHFGVYFSTIGFFFPGNDTKQNMLFLSTEIDVRYYTPGRLFFGARMFLGQQRTTTVDNAPTSIGMAIEPVVGLHWTTQKIGEHGVPFRQIDKRFDQGYYRFRTYKGHTLGLRPFLGLMGNGYIGAHLTWEYYSFTERDEDIEDIASSTLSRRKKMFMLEGELRNAFSFGYISGLGWGGSWRGTLTTGMLHLAFTLGFYYGDTLSVFILPTVGLLFQ